MKLAPKIKVMLYLSTLALLTGCAGDLPPDVIDPSGNLDRADYKALRDRQPETLPKPETPPPIPELSATPAAPPLLPGNGKKVTLTVTDKVPLRDVLMELARKANVNMELAPHLRGSVEFTAHDQPFDLVLQHICNLAGLRYTVDGDFIHIENDDPYQHTYQLDYLSLSRRATSETSISTNVFDVDVAGNNGANNSARNTGSGGDNNSSSKIAGASDADFWSEVEKSLTQILDSNKRKTDKDEKDGPNFSMDKQAGILTVYGDSRQQAAVASYLQKLRRKAYAQVLIDARIVEVELNDTYKTGINWRTLFNGSLNAAARFGPAAVGAPFTAATTATDGVFSAALNDHDFSGILNLVRTFGTTRVLSAPRLTVLNNQTAVLKVATNQVYFVTQAQFSTSTTGNGTTVTGTPVYTSTPRTVPVGLVMTVQPSIDADNNRVTMTLRPTISRVVSTVNDPSIGLNAAAANITNPIQSAIPVLAVREMDSVIQLHSGEVAILGGLMQDSSLNTEAGVPPLDTVPVLGNLAKSRDNQGTTTELVILLRAVVTDTPPPDAADVELYHKYNNDPRPLPLPDLPKQTNNPKQEEPT